MDILKNSIVYLKKSGKNLYYFEKSNNIFEKIQLNFRDSF